MDGMPAGKQPTVPTVLGNGSAQIQLQHFRSHPVLSAVLSMVAFFKTYTFNTLVSTY